MKFNWKCRAQNWSPFLCYRCYILANAIILYWKMNWLKMLLCVLNCEAIENWKDSARLCRWRVGRDGIMIGRRERAWIKWAFNVKAVSFFFFYFSFNWCILNICTFVAHIHIHTYTKINWIESDKWNAIEAIEWFNKRIVPLTHSWMC